MHMTRRAPVLSATSSSDCIWIIAASPTLSACGRSLSRSGRRFFCRQLPSGARPVLDPALRTWKASQAGGKPRSRPRSFTGRPRWAKQAIMTRIAPFGKIRATLSRSDRLGLLEQARHAPRLGLGELAAGLDLHQIADLVLVVLVVRVVFLGLGDDLAVDRVLHAA